MNIKIGNIVRAKESVESNIQGKKWKLCDKGDQLVVLSINRDFTATVKPLNHEYEFKIYLSKIQE